MITLEAMHASVTPKDVGGELSWEKNTGVKIYE
jgi:hypothetical protein